jgi:hypothetical protein
MSHFFRILLITASVLGVAACALDGADPGAPAAGTEASDESVVSSADTAYPGWHSATASQTDSVTPAACTPLVSNGAACLSGLACLYQNANFSGMGVAVTRGCSIANLNSIPCPRCTKGTFNDQMTSWRNLSGVRYCWYYDANFSTTNVFHHMGNGDGINVAPADNDRASSLGPC